MNLVYRTSLEKTTSLPEREIRYIVVHYTAWETSEAGSAAKVAKYFSDSDRPASADYIVDDTTAVQYNPDPANRCCWHCMGERTDSHGGSLYRLCTNANSIGVEICSSNSAGTITFANDPRYFFTDAVLAQTAELIGRLMDTYSIDISHVVRHYDVSGTLCPGIIGWNEDSGDAESWYEFRQECKKHSALANRQSGCTISGSDILRVLRENGIVCQADAHFLQTVFSSLAVHSDEVSPGTLFFCKGEHFRSEYLLSAAEHGAAAYISEKKMETELPGLVVSDVCAAMGWIAQAFYGYPENALTTVGVTGTNGKTTVSGFVANILKNNTESSRDFSRPSARMTAGWRGNCL